MKKIFCIIGYTGVGKDTLVNGAKEILGDKVGILVSHTTRPMRKNEREGKEYYFVDTKEFLRMKEYNCFVETRKYNTKVEKDGEIVDDTWYYGLSLEEVEKYNYSMFIVDTDGFMEVRERFGRERVIPIYINVKEDILRERLKNRGDLEEEVNRRLADDKAKFLQFQVHMVYKTIRNNDNIEVAIDELVGYICKMMGMNKICKKRK